jgi:hypothetical protein
MREYADLLHLSLELLTPQSAFEVARLAVARHVAFYEQRVSEPEMIEAWLLAVRQRQSLEGRKDLRFHYWQQDPNTLQWSICWGFSQLTTFYYATFFPEKLPVPLDGAFDLCSGLMTLMHCLMRDIREKFPLIQIDLSQEGTPEFEAALARETAYRDSPERLQRQKDIWSPVVDDMERLFLLQEHAHPSKRLDQMRDEWPWPMWSYRIWNQYLNYKARSDKENPLKRD